MNKGLVLVIVFLFVVMSFTSISGIQINNQIIKSSGRGDIFYVGGSGEGNYTKIQDAIDNASDGDTVFVYDDSSPYIEKIVIEKSINLIGENKDTTVIKGNCIKIEEGGDGVNVIGFTLDHGNVMALDWSKNIVISDNHFLGSGIGIGFDGIDDSYIISNIFTDCESSIWFYGGCGNIIISDNIFVYDTIDNYPYYEIWCGYSSIGLTNNTFINYNKGVGRAALHLEQSGGCIIKNNEFNGYDSVILGYMARKNIISHNTFINNDWCISMGISSSNKIKNNNFINNNVDAHIMRFTFSFNNVFDGNYWDEWIGLKYPILSFLPHFSYELLDFIPTGFIIDWHPAKEPYNYTTTQGCGII